MNAYKDFAYGTKDVYSAFSLGKIAVMMSDDHDRDLNESPDGSDEDAEFGAEEIDAVRRAFITMRRDDDDDDVGGGGAGMCDGEGFIEFNKLDVHIRATSHVKSSDNMAASGSKVCKVCNSGRPKDLAVIPDKEILLELARGWSLYGKEYGGGGGGGRVSIAWMCDDDDDDDDEEEEEEEEEERDDCRMKKEHADCCEEHADIG
ncbi:hypothetical protein CAPTEDRAFT_213153 [Capitella teleta]|uniref:Uncharacterized protein n=1 Tax=Capitella teleta TaxID=283909 RepID=R7TCZ8_CAPTE|nr:hypothetical protein CAPTEDRAFT_213153 [Capitella teleta]|eukprot:ELT89357.1 hypothetical protein CAPTEDRAFT_213153 [Capitella teleta]